MEILFITATRIGDAVLSTSVLEALYHRYPQAQFTIACGPLAAPLFQNFPALKKIVVFRKGRFLKHWRDLWRETFRIPWECVVDLRGSALAYFLRKKRQYIWCSVPSSHHRILQMAHLLKLAEPVPPKIWIDSESHRKALDLLPPTQTYIGIGSTAHWPGKEWSPHGFKCLIENLTSPSGVLPGAQGVLFASSKEKERVQVLKDLLPPQSLIDLSGKTTLLETAACLKRCTLYVGNDSGVMHLSAACGVPTVGLFGPSRVEHYAPWGPYTRAVTTHESYETLMQFHHHQENLLGTLSVEDVEKAVQELLTSKTQEDSDPSIQKEKDPQ